MDILLNFESEIKLVENHLKMVKNTYEDKDSVTLLDTVTLLRDLAIIDYLEKNDEKNEVFEEEIVETIKKVGNEMVRKDKIFKKIYNSFLIKIDEDGDIEIKMTHPGLLKSLLSKDDEKDEFNEIFAYKTVLYNLCSSIENVFSSMLKDFYLKIDQSNRMDKLNLTLKELKEIDNINDAEVMLLEKEIENKFYTSFNNWIESIENEVKFKNINKAKNIKEEKVFINELFLVRNLFIHNTGKINDKFKNKTFLHKNLDKDTEFPLDLEFINKSINITRNFIFNYVYEYYFSKYNDKERISHYFDIMNSILLKYLDSNLQAIPRIFEGLSENELLNNMQKSIALVNYYINRYHNLNEDEFTNLLSKLDFSAHELQFKMAEAILKNNKNAFELLNEFLSTEDEDTVFNIYDWPLIKIARSNDDRVKELLKNKIIDILSIKGDESDGYKEEKN
ncbi:TPA: hypothetical protein I1891_001783 [Staphylococcus pseudintermedius]|nr:hypothetical protein [Staphylococcus pseudintermedius]EHL7166355.1 hypothetical protein [Staphylococcus pseudintermedius]EII2696374.1 hypothetical protein [Staphylococcus pseudintermedius]EIM5192037.1 hypothetical protein [Staphylococcus pseudintermedius]MCE5443150.1 hypothetical protein [Staphylococcus pseudintermedius]